MLPAQPNQSLIDGLAVLQAVSTSADPVGSRELARRLGLESTRVNRLLKTLAALGLCQQDAAKKYAPGPGLHVLAATALFGSRLLTTAAGPIENLRAQAPTLTVALGVRWRREVAYLLFAPPGTPLVAGVGRTALFPAERSSIGRVLLAALPDTEVRSLYTDDTPALRHALSESLAEVRERGYALVQGDEQSLAVPLGPDAAPTAALALAGKASARELPDLVRLLKDTARQIHDVSHP